MLWPNVINWLKKKQCTLSQDTPSLVLFIISWVYKMMRQHGLYFLLLVMVDIIKLCSNWTAKARCSKRIKIRFLGCKSRVLCDHGLKLYFSIFCPISTCCCWDLNYTGIIKVKAYLIISPLLLFFSQRAFRSRLYRDLLHRRWAAGDCG